MAFKDWTLKGLPLAWYIGVGTATIITLGALTEIITRQGRIRALEERARTALTQPASQPIPQTRNSDEIYFNVMTGEITDSPYTREEKDYSSRN